MRNATRNSPLPATANNNRTRIGGDCVPVTTTEVWLTG